MNRRTKSLQSGRAIVSGPARLSPRNQLHAAFYLIIIFILEQRRAAPNGSQLAAGYCRPAAANWRQPSRPAGSNRARPGSIDNLLGAATGAKQMVRSRRIPLKVIWAPSDRQAQIMNGIRSLVGADDGK